MRLDKYLKVSRLIKRRTVANDAVMQAGLRLMIRLPRHRLMSKRAMLLRLNLVINQSR